VFIVDDDQAVRDSMQLSLEKSNLAVETYASADDFLNAYDPDRPGCLVVDIRMPGMSGLELQEALFARDSRLPVIFITGHADIPASVQAMRTGAFDFLEKPYHKDALLARIDEAFALNSKNRAEEAEIGALRARFSRLSPREREVMTLIVAGASTASNRQIGEQLGLSRRTIDNYRAWVMEKMQARSLPELVHLAKQLGVYKP
jgi:FixJ family two-component response regulator